jgi:hypothetical protein
VRYIREGLLSAAFIAIVAMVSKRRASLVLVLALGAAAALPWYAYGQGHPVRVRYAVPLVAACAAWIGTAIGTLWAPLRVLAAVLLAFALASDWRPLDHAAPVVVEARHYDGTLLMISMGSLGHYMHDLSEAGLYIRDFLHEGNGEIWPYALARPRPYAGWIALEERAEGGDALFRATKRDGRWLAGYERVAEGGGVALYRRTQR